MNNQQKFLGKLLEKRRKEQGLSKKEMVLKLGYLNINRGIRRVNAIENGEVIREVTVKMMRILGVTQEEMATCEKKQAEWIDSLPPIKPYIVVRIIPAIYLNADVPQHLTEEEMVEYAIALSKRQNRYVCLQYARAKRYWINPNGSYTIDTELQGGPSMSMDLSKILTVDIN